MVTKLSQDDKKKLSVLLGLSEDASHDRVVEEMKIAIEAQERLVENKTDDTDRRVLEWEIKLLMWKIKLDTSAFLFWNLFYEYEKEFKLNLTKPLDLVFISK